MTPSSGTGFTPGQAGQAGTVSVDTGATPEQIYRVDSGDIQTKTFTLPAGLAVTPPFRWSAGRPPNGPVAPQGECPGTYSRTVCSVDTGPSGQTTISLVSDYAATTYLSPYVRYTFPVHTTAQVAEGQDITASFVTPDGVDQTGPREGAAPVPVVGAPAPVVEVTPFDVQSGPQGGQVWAQVNVRNTGPVGTGAQEVTVTAPAGFGFARQSLTLNSSGPAHPCDAPAGQVMTCPDIPLNLDPGQTAKVSALLSVGADTAAQPYQVPFAVGTGGSAGAGHATVTVTAVAPVPELSVTADGVSSGEQGAPRVEAKVLVHNSGTVPVGVVTVTVTAPAVFSWADSKLYLWRHGQEQYDCTVSGQMLTCPDVALDLAPGGNVWLYPHLSVAADAAVREHDVPFRIGDPVIGSGAARVEVLPAPTQQVTVTADGKTTGQQGAPRVGAHVKVENTGTGFVGSQTVTVTAPAGFSFAAPAMYLWRDTAAGMGAGRGGPPGQEEYPCTTSADAMVLTCADVPLNLQPGRSVVLYPQLAVDPDARVDEHDVPFTVGDPQIGSGDAVVEVTAAPVPQVSVTAAGDVSGAPGEVRGAEVIVQNTGVTGVGEHAVTVTAPAGWAFTQDTLHLWRESTNQAEEHPCVRSDQDRILTCAGVPVNLAPGQWAVLFPQVRIAADATPSDYHVDYVIGEQPAPVGTGHAIITVTGNTG